MRPIHLGDVIEDVPDDLIFSHLTVKGVDEFFNVFGIFNVGFQVELFFMPRRRKDSK